jgi:hypothetical protein
MLVRKETRFEVEVRSYRLSRRPFGSSGLGEAVVGSSSVQDAQVPIDIDPPTRRPRTGGAYPYTLKVDKNTDMLE